MLGTLRTIVQGLGTALAAILCLSLQTAGLNGATPQGSPSTAPGDTSKRELLNKYCVTCHNERLHTAGLTLEKMDVEHVGANAEVWEKVLRKVATGVMPPPGLPRPDAATSAGFTSWLQTTLDRAAAAKPNPGRVAMHRLNQTEYTNAIRDLLGLDINGRSILGLDDAGENGFDNMAS